MPGLSRRARIAERCPAATAGVGEICGRCHWPGALNGPLTATLELHTHHKANSPGSACVACHMPKIAQTIADVSVRNHTFSFITPGTSERLKVPNPCTTCHTNKTNQWAIDTMKTWPEVSPWRIGP